MSGTISIGTVPFPDDSAVERAAPLLQLGSKRTFANDPEGHGEWLDGSYERFEVLLPSDPPDVHNRASFLGTGFRPEKLCIHIIGQHRDAVCNLGDTGAELRLHPIGGHRDPMSVPDYLFLDGTGINRFR